MSPNPEWDNYTPELRLAREISDARDALGRENDRLKSERDRAISLLLVALTYGIPGDGSWEAKVRAFLKEVDNG